MKMTKPLAALALALLVGTPLSAAMIIVDAAGSGDYLTIQEGLSAASAGDTVLVAQGTYTGALNRELDFGGRAITLLSDEGPDVTTIDCQGLGRAFLFDDGEDSLAIVDGLAVENGSADRGGAILIEHASPRIRTCRFQGCSSTEAGGAVLIDGGSPSFRACGFTDNTSAIGGAAAVYQSEARFAQCEFDWNSATATGGALACYYVPVPSVSDCSFADNLAYGLGGAIYLRGSSASITRSSFMRNRSPRGALTGDYASPAISYCTFARILEPPRAGSGHAIDLFHTDIGQATITSCTIAAWFLGSSNPYLVYFADCAPVIETSIFALYNQGGAAACGGVGGPTFTHCISYGNSGGDILPGDGTDNSVADPLFCGFWDNNLTVAEASPCLPQNNLWGIAVGALGQGCEGSNPGVEPLTWGRLKAMYR